MRKIKDIYPFFPWLVLILASVFAVALFLNRDSGVQFKILVMAAITYLAVASWYHFRDRSLTFEIIIEYILLAALALVII